MAKKEMALTAPGTYEIVKADPQALSDVIKTNLGGQQITEFDLERVRVPGGGGTTWEIGEEEAAKELEGIIVHWRDGAAYWKRAFGDSGGGTPPDCSSIDGIYGIGDPGGECAKCPFNEFGSAQREDGSPGRGKACKNFRVLFMVRPEELLPLAVIVPPTSLREARKYFLRLASKAINYHSLTTRIMLEKTKSADGIEYAHMKMSAGQRLSDKEADIIRQYVVAIGGAFTAPIDVSPQDVSGG